MNLQRILYIQYTNPAGYPPLEHSSRLLAERGWDVWFLGTGGQGSSKLTFPHHTRIRVSKMPFQTPGWRQKVHYFRYCTWVMRTALQWRPQWLYASDLWSCLPALILRSVPGLRILYHEHDSPDEQTARGLVRIFLIARHRLAQRADLCVLPSQARAQRFCTVTGAKPQQVRVVWNCPRLEEVGPLRNVLNDSKLTLYYHGNLGSHLLPMSVIDAMAEIGAQARLLAIGYETVGTQGYIADFQRYATQRGVVQRIWIDAARPRSLLWEKLRLSDIGLILLDCEGNVNMQHLVGASNKVFDYMAGGLALLVPDQPDWRSFFVDPGYALACNPNNPASIASAIRWYIKHPDAMRAMGELGRQRILSDWNYEHQFAPVLAQLEAPV